MTDVPEELRQEVEKWRNLKRERPEHIEVPGPGQESVWDYPRPPRVEAVDNPIRVEFVGIIIANSVRAYRVLETSSPPVYYLSPGDVRTDYLEPSGHSTLCEWKGVGWYWSVRVTDRFVKNAAWSYSQPWVGYEAIKDHIAFNAGKMDACYVGEHRVTPQPGKYYGGWITPDIVGPFKGERGTQKW